MNVLRQFWYPVLWSKDLTDKPMSVKLLDQPLVLWRVNGTVSAFYDLCLHRGAASSRLPTERIPCIFIYCRRA